MSQSKLNHIKNWLYTPEHPYRILIIGGSGSGKSNVLWNLVKYLRPNIHRFINT